MSETKPPSAAAEKMAKDLKATLTQRRPPRWKTALLALAICALILGGAVWWFSPKARLDPLQIVAFDELCSPAEKLRVRAELFPPLAEESPRRMSGHTVFFLDPPALLQPVMDTLKTAAPSDEHGQASTDWPTPAKAFAEFRAETIDVVEKAKALDHGRIFVCAQDAPLFLVDVDETLKGANVEEAAKTLTRAASEGWQIVYLSVAGDRPIDYRRTRDWTIAQANLPRGPILGRIHFGSLSESAWSDRWQSLRRRFTGDMVAVVKSAEAASAAKSAGLSTFQLDAAPIAGVVGVASWLDVPVRRKK